MIPCIHNYPAAQRTLAAFVGANIFLKKPKPRPNPPHRTRSSWPEQTWPQCLKILTPHKPANICKLPSVPDLLIIKQFFHYLSLTSLKKLADARWSSHFFIIRSIYRIILRLFGSSFFDPEGSHLILRPKRIPQNIRWDASQFGDCRSACKI